MKKINKKLTSYMQYGDIRDLLVLPGEIIYTVIVLLILPQGILKQSAALDR